MASEHSQWRGFVEKAKSHPGMERRNDDGRVLTSTRSPYPCPALDKRDAYMNR